MSRIEYKSQPANHLTAITDDTRLPCFATAAAFGSCTERTARPHYAYARIIPALPDLRACPEVHRRVIGWVRS